MKPPSPPATPASYTPGAPGGPQALAIGYTASGSHPTSTTHSPATHANSPSSAVLPHTATHDPLLIVIGTVLFLLGGGGLAMALSWFRRSA